MMVWIAFILLVVLILLGAPVPACFGGAVMFLMFTLGYDGNMLLNTAYNSLNAYNLLAIPLFIMAGGIMEKGNIGEALVGWITMFFGRVRASLAIVTSVVSAIFGSVCGSGAATLSCIGSMVAPRMREKNYPMAIGASVSVCAAPLGLLIPPSAMQILYAFLTQKSVLGCFLAIVIPGIILCILIAISGWFLMRKDDPLAEKEDLRISDLKGLPLICSRQWIDQESPRWFGAEAKDVNIVATYNLVYNGAVMVRAGMGCAIVLDKLVSTGSDSELLFRTLPGVPQTGMYVIWRKYQTFTPIAELLVEELKSRLG